jgi:hypothetical protein
VLIFRRYKAHITRDFCYQYRSQVAFRFYRYYAIQSITGSMQIYTLDNKTIVLFNPLSNEIDCLDIPTSRKKPYFQIPRKHGAESVTSDGSAHFEIHVAKAIGNKHIFEIELKRCCNKHRHFVFVKTYTDFPSL